MLCLQKARLNTWLVWADFSTHKLCSVPVLLLWDEQQYSIPRLNKMLFCVFLFFFFFVKSFMWVMTFKSWWPNNCADLSGYYSVTRPLKTIPKSSKRGLMTGWSLVVGGDMDFFKGGVQKVVLKEVSFLIRAVSHQDSPSSVRSVIRVMYHQGGVSSGWCIIRVVFHQADWSSG